MKKVEYQAFSKKYKATKTNLHSPAQSVKAVFASKMFWAKVYGGVFFLLYGWLKVQLPAKNRQSPHFKPQYKGNALGKHRRTKFWGNGVLFLGFRYWLRHEKS